MALPLAKRKRSRVQVHVPFKALALELPRAFFALAAMVLDSGFINPDDTLFLLSGATVSKWGVFPAQISSSDNELPGTSQQEQQLWRNQSVGFAMRLFQGTGANVDSPRRKGE